MKIVLMENFSLLEVIMDAITALNKITKKI